MFNLAIGLGKSSHDTISSAEYYDLSGCPSLSLVKVSLNPEVDIISNHLQLKRKVPKAIVEAGQVSDKVAAQEPWKASRVRGKAKIF